MEQLTQKLRSGEMVVSTVPRPVCPTGFLLVRNHFSLISAGTEASTVKTARASLLQKARERPQQVQQVLAVLRAQGPVQTYRAVMKKLDAYSPLGYSCAGEVIEVGLGVEGFAVGDKVACAGAGYANHAEVVTIPQRLCVRLPGDADLRAAAYNTLGAIALQGIRQADLRLGESCMVIGLGLIGQLTGLMLRASGVKVIGVDVEPVAVETAARHAVDLALLRSTQGIAEQVSQFTGGLGVDAVIVTAGSSSLDPVNFAGEVLRKKGRVVVVGAVPTGFDRDPHYYRKELELRMSCSYGPGRYDLTYEEKGLDYPPAYVRWTENRNMAAFQELIQRGRVDLDYLTTHEVSLERSPQAYDMIVNRSEPFLGVVIKYDSARQLDDDRVPVAQPRPQSKVGVAFIGAGSYAQSNLLPNLPRNDPDVVRRGVMCSTGTTSKRVAERFGFEFCTADESDILGNDSISTVFIATRHDTHAGYVLKALRAGKSVFVEKPLALTLEDLESIRAAYVVRSDLALLVGFNRRFAPLVVALKERLSNSPMAIVYRVNAGAIAADHWIQDVQIGGRRIIGEACHFVDLMTFLCGALPVSVYCSALADPQHLNDTVTIQVSFANGSIGTLAYFANGAKALSKEYLEVYQCGFTGILDDFRELKMYGKGRPEQRKLLNQDKGQAAMMKVFFEGLKKGHKAVIPFEEIFSVALATLAAERSLLERWPVRLSPEALADGIGTPAGAGHAGV